MRVVGEAASATTVVGGVEKLFQGEAAGRWKLRRCMQTRCGHGSRDGHASEAGIRAIGRVDSEEPGMMMSLPSSSARSGDGDGLRVIRERECRGRKS
jgi:hypothetical protein